MVERGDPRDVLRLLLVSLLALARLLLGALPEDRAEDDAHDDHEAEPRDRAGDEEEGAHQRAASRRSSISRVIANRRRRAVKSRERETGSSCFMRSRWAKFSSASIR